jgi:hypothetical protein
MAGWQDRVNQLLYEGETVEDSLDLDTATLVITSHRVMAFTPASDGANFRGVERPNVAGAAHGSRDRKSFLWYAGQAGGAGLALVVVGVLIDFDALVGGVDFGLESTAGLGIGGILQMVQQLLALIAMLDEISQLLGALLLLVAAGLLGLYAWTREPTIVVEVAGDDDIHLPRPDGDPGVLERVQGALTPDGVDASVPDDPLAE